MPITRQHTSQSLPAPTFPDVPSDVEDGARALTPPPQAASAEEASGAMPKSPSCAFRTKIPNVRGLPTREKHIRFTEAIHERDGFIEAMKEERAALLEQMERRERQWVEQLRQVQGELYRAQAVKSQDQVIRSPNIEPRGQGQDEGLLEQQRREIDYWRSLALSRSSRVDEAKHKEPASENPTPNFLLGVENSFTGPLPSVLRPANPSNNTYTPLVNETQDWSKWVKIPFFDGSKGSTVRGFLEKVEKVGTLYNMTDGDKRVLLEAHLTGKADDFYRVVKSSIFNFNEAKRMLTKRFSPAPTSRDLLIRLLQERRESSKESVSDFLDRIRETKTALQELLSQGADVRDSFLDQLAVYSFAAALPEPYRTQLFTRFPRDLEEAESYYNQLRTIPSFREDPILMISPTPAPRKSMKVPDPAPRSVQPDIKQRTYSRDNVNRSQHTKRPSSPSFQKTYRPPSPRSQNEYRPTSPIQHHRKRNWCSICHEHIWKGYCPERPSRPNSPYYREKNREYSPIRSNSPKYREKSREHSPNGYEGPSRHLEEYYTYQKNGRRSRDVDSRY